MEGCWRGFAAIPLVLALVLSLALIAAPALSAPDVVSVKVIVDATEYHHYPTPPPSENALVAPGQVFIIRHRLRWDEPEPGSYVIGIYWDSPGEDGTPSENFTFLYARAYFDNGGAIENTVRFREGVVAGNRRYTVVVSAEAYDDYRNGEFNVDIVMRASGAGGVSHAAGYHKISYSGTIDVWEGSTPSITVGPTTMRIFGRSVAVSISPKYRSGTPGTTLSYTVTVKNTGSLDDNYILTASDNAGWSPTVSPTLLTIPAGENGTATLVVTIPEGAEVGTSDNITVVATSAGDPSVRDNASCIAHALITRGVDISISPNYQSGTPGATLGYVVTVSNTGDVEDNYILTASDDAGWGPTLSPTLLTVPAKGSGTAALSVTIPADVELGMKDNITVVATSQADPSVSDNASCIAHAAIRGVEITISPNFQRAGPDYNIWGDYDLAYTVTVTNRGALPDNFILTADDGLGWDLRIVGRILLGMSSGESRSATLYLAVPADAEPGTEDIILITATSLTDKAVSSYATCFAQSGVIAFEVSVSPSKQSGDYSQNIDETEYDLKYAVTVVNKGTIVDNYVLTVSDNLGWGLMFVHNILTVPAGENRSTTLYVGIPSPLEPNSSPCTSDNITVVATSQADPSVSDNASCIAHIAVVDMEVKISPSFLSGFPGEDLVYTVTIKNTGSVAIEYRIDPWNVYDNAGWGPKADDNMLFIENGKSSTTKLRVKIPDNVAHNTHDNLTVEVWALAPQIEKLVRKKSSTIAHAATLKLSILPELKVGNPGSTLSYLIAIRNIGFENDNYALSVSDSAGWGPMLDNYLFQNVGPGESRTTTLIVIIPPNAARGTDDNITITVASAKEGALRESVNCTALVAPPRGVRVSISPKSQGGMPGATLTYAVIVQNVGTENDNYNLTASDDAGWELVLSEDLLMVPGLGRKGVILEIVIPGEATAGFVNNILITVTSRENATISVSASCEVHVETPAAIVRGSKNAYNLHAEQENVPPEVWYGSGNRDKEDYVGDYPPLMAARRVGEGAVIAAGFAGLIRDTRWNPTPPKETAKLDILLDKAFQWMKPGAKKVLWYEGYYVYNTTARCKDLVAALSDKGYAIKADTTEPITLSLLEPYDILVLPELQLPRWDSKNPWAPKGGDPSLLPDNDVRAIKAFVEGGGGVLILDWADTFGNNYYKIQNKVLAGLGIYDIYFQSDQVNDSDFDPAYYFNAEVTLRDFGAAYREATGLTQVWVYSPCSLVVKPEKKKLDVYPSISPSWLKGLPGETLTYTLTVVNSGKLGDTYLLDIVDDAGFSVSVQPSTMTLAAGENQTATLSVKIPKGTPRGKESTIAIAVTSISDPTLGSVSYTKAWAGALGASASISPENRSGKLGENLKFIVYVANTGDFDDNYVLTISDNAGWGLRISPGVLSVPENSRKFATLEVTIPENAASGARDNITAKATSQTDNAVSARVSCTAQVTPFTRKVSVSISPSENSGAPGENVTFTVTVRNLGDVLDNFLLMVSDNSGWGLKLDDNALAISPGGSSTTKLRVSIPENAKYGTKDNIKVIARSKQDNAIENSASCIAHAIAREGVTISISPSEKTGAPGENVTFTVTVKNTGRVKDNYGLTVGDTAGWGLTLSENLLTNVENGASRTVTLTVAIPAGAENGTSDRITVTARSKTDNAIENSASCTARASIAVVRGVGVSISPDNRRGLPGRTLTFTVTVKNTGGAEDTYDLTVSDDAGWGAALSVNLLTIQAGGSATSEVSVAVPSEAAKDESTMITVTATSRGDPRVSGSAWCTAMAGEEEPPPFSLVPLAIGGAVVGGGATITLLLKKGIIPSPQMLRARRLRALGPLRVGQLKRAERKMGISLKGVEKPSLLRLRKGKRGILASVAG